MNVVFYIIIFIIGLLLGDFYVTSARRMKKGKKIFSIHSYCSNCGEKLKILEKIPILSYLFLKGKCKHCNKKIKIQYILGEILAGILFLLIAVMLDINATSITSFIFIILYFSYIILAMIMDKEARNIPQKLLTYGIIISLIYIVYLCIIDRTAIYKNAIYLLIMVILLLIDTINTKKLAQESYVIELLTTLLIMLIFTEEITCILTIIGTLITIALYILINKISKIKSKGKKDKNKFSSRIRIILIMGILNIITFLLLITICR